MTLLQYLKKSAYDIEALIQTVYENATLCFRMERMENCNSLEKNLTPKRQKKKKNL